MSNKNNSRLIKQKVFLFVLICSSFFSLSACFDRQNSENPSRSLGLSEGPGFKCLMRDQADNSIIKLYVAQDPDKITLHEDSDTGVTMPHYITVNNQNYNEFPLVSLRSPDILSAKRLVKQDFRDNRKKFLYIRVIIEEQKNSGFIDLYNVVLDEFDRELSQSQQVLLAVLSDCQRV